MAAVVAAVYFLRLEVAVPTAGSIYFSSGTADQVVLVESTMLLPLLFIIIAALFATLAQRMGREMAVLPPLQGYTVNIVGSLVGVVSLFALISWFELPPGMWFGVAFAAALPLVVLAEPGRHAPRAALVSSTCSFLGLSLVFVHVIARGALWSPYYKITVVQEGQETVVEVNNIFHQSMAPVEHKEYFYQWPYTVFGDIVRECSDPWRRFRHRRCRRAAPRSEARRCRGDRSHDHPPRPRTASRPSVP